ncbi:hypothetical protein R3P38DRAFT_3340091 [Favolaschia claudopus]|uniref:Uncharacterized protein n=1 Tax=Favolaschia claudopus TaxID=2862362 RepID=A0AAW0EJ49_9AGAR
MPKDVALECRKVQACAAESAREPADKEKIGDGGREQAARKHRQTEFDSSTPESGIGSSTLLLSTFIIIFRFAGVSGWGVSESGAWNRGISEMKAKFPGDLGIKPTTSRHVRSYQLFPPLVPIGCP